MISPLRKANNRARQYSRIIRLIPGPPLRHSPRPRTPPLTRPSPAPSGHRPIPATTTRVTRAPRAPLTPQPEAQ